MPGSKAKHCSHVAVCKAANMACSSAPAIQKHAAATDSSWMCSIRDGFSWKIVQQTKIEPGNHEASHYASRRSSTKHVAFIRAVLLIAHHAASVSPAAFGVNSRSQAFTATIVNLLLYNAVRSSIKLL